MGGGAPVKGGNMTPSLRSCPGHEDLHELEGEVEGGAGALACDALAVHHHRVGGHLIGEAEGVAKLDD